MGRDERLDDMAMNISVSTHAPAWGATIPKEYVRRIKIVSTHAPAWGATYWRLETRMGRRVSTHAPAWGATLRVQVERQEHICFNSRARVGRDILLRCYVILHL